MKRPLTLTASVMLTASFALTGCGNGDDGKGVTSLGDKTSSGSSSGSGSGSSSGLGSDLKQGSDNPLVNQAVTEYTTYVQGQADELVKKTKVFTDAVRAGNVEAAKAAYAPSREPWERIEPIAGLVEELDGSLDSRVDDFEGVDDPKFTGWHRLEYILWEKGTTEGAAEFADKLDADVATLQKEVKTLKIPAAAVPVGASELIEEVSQGKITGEEDRYSKTDLWDLGANVEGSKAALDTLGPALAEANPELKKKTDAAFAELDTTLQPLRQGEGWKLYCVVDDKYPSKACNETTITAETLNQLKAQTAALSELTSQVAGALELK